MKSIAVALVMSGVSLVAQAQFKCVGPGGTVSFQQMPCASSHKGQSLQLRDARPQPVPEVDPGGAPKKPKLLPDEIIVQRMQRERRLRELDQEIESLEKDLAWRSGAMERELSVLQTRRQSAMNNLAGATLEQSISTEMLAVAQKHQALSGITNERLKMLRTERAGLQP